MSFSVASFSFSMRHCWQCSQFSTIPLPHVEHYDPRSFELLEKLVIIPHYNYICKNYCCLYGNTLFYMAKQFHLFALNLSKAFLLLFLLFFICISCTSSKRLRGTTDGGTTSFPPSKNPMSQVRQKACELPKSTQ